MFGQYPRNKREISHISHDKLTCGYRLAKTPPQVIKGRDPMARLAQLLERMVDLAIRPERAVG